MSVRAYHNVFTQAQQLSADEQVRLMEELLELLYEQSEPLKSVKNTVRQVEENLKLLENALMQARQKASGVQKQYNITELRGLGKEIWEGIDAQEYVNKERNSWDG